MSSKLYLHQAISTHNKEFKFLSSARGDDATHRIMRSIISSLRNLFKSSNDVDRCAGQIITSVDGRDYVAIAYLESAIGPERRPFIHVHAIMVDRDTYVENDLNFIYFRDKFTEYSKIMEVLDSIKDLPKVEFSKPSDEELVKLLNNILGRRDLKNMLEIIVGVIAGYIRPGDLIRVNARSYDEAVNLAGTLLQLLPPNLRAGISIFAGDIKNISRRDVVVISTRGETLYTPPPRGYKIVNEIMEIIESKQDISEKLRKLRELHRRYYDEYRGLREENLDTDKANKALLDEEQKRSILEQVREEKRRKYLNETMQYLKEGNSQRAMESYNKYLELGGNRDPKIEVIFAFKGIPNYSLESITKRFKEEDILSIINDLISGKTISESDLMSYSDKLLEMLRHRVEGINRCEKYSGLCKLLIENVTDLKTLYSLYANNMISREDLEKRFFSNLDSSKLERYREDELKRIFQRKFHEIRELLEKHPQDPDINDLLNKFVKKIKETFVVEKPKLIGHKYQFKLSPRIFIELILGISLPEAPPKDSILSMIWQRDKKSGEELYELVLLAFREWGRL